MSNQPVTNVNVTERLQIIDYLHSRIEDFEACTKDDSCKDIIYVLEGIVKDIEYGEHLEQGT